MGVPNVFGSATTSIPLSQLDANFNTGLTIGNTTIGLGNTTTTLGNVTLSNVSIVSSPNANVTIGNTTIGIGNTATSLDNVTLANSTINFAASLSLGNSTVNTALGQGNASAMKNRIINGAMVIDQRNGGASVTNVGGASSYSLDRWQYYASQASKFTIQQNAGSVTPPVGFVNYLGITSTSAYTVGTSEIFQLAQYIEGFNIADLGWGTANAKAITISFWVRSSLTGTFGGSLRNENTDRSYPFSYTISAANTWQQITLNIAGDTTGTWGTTNGTGIRLAFGLGMGSSFSGTAGSWASANYISATGATSVVGTNGATFYITGVQLEVGSSATGFEYVNYQTSLANCQRYFIKYGGDQVYEHVASGMGIAGTQAQCDTPMPVPMRTTPSSSISTLALNDGVGSLITITSGNIQTTESSPRRTSITYIVASGVTNYRPYNVNTNNSTSGYLALSAEL